MVELTEKQEKAAKQIIDWFFRPGDMEFYLAGYAGTGKSTIVSEVIKRLNHEINNRGPDLDKEDKVETHLNVVYCAFTGKAASVLASKGNEPASTIHSLIYRPNKIEKMVGTKIIETVEFVLKEKDLATPEDYIFGADLLVLDECSMVDQALANDLRKFEKKILIIGDPGQLPPVQGQGAFTSRKPDLFLDEVLRQASDSPIIRLATMARQKEIINYGDYGDAKVINKKYLDDFCVKPDWQTICGLNNSRARIINYIRKHLGYNSPFPYANEPLICLRNNVKDLLFNGLITECLETFEKPFDERFIEDYEYLNEFQALDLETFNGTYTVDARYFLSTHFNDRKLRTLCDNQRSKGINAFDYSYAITCHKAQGSQWDNVLILDESWVSMFEPIKHLWLYTAITRAVKKVIILK